MVKKIIINVLPEETRMALTEDGQLMEVSVERTDSGHVVGNIYQGKVKNILPGIQAAFVDIGREKNAFLYIGDAFPHHSAEQGPQVQRQLTAGQDIMIQVVKDAIGSKGPRVTAHLTLPGRYTVLMPTVEYTGISRRIADEDERERLKALAHHVCPAGMGLIVRTVAEGKSEADLKRDVDYLVSLWNSLAARAKRACAPALLYRDVDLVIRIVRDYFAEDISQFVVNNQEAYGRVCDLLNFISPELAPRVVLYQGREDIFSHYGLDDELEKLGQRNVPLKCGGYIVIDKTEALTVIDVNTGRYVGQTNLSDTVFRTNLEAVEEIARQIRLRDIGGIIIVDFIDMNRPEHQQEVLKKLEENLKNDRTRTHILGITGLGLVEMTRKKSRQNIESMFYTECPCCGGRGRVKSPETVIIDIRRRLRKLSGDRQRKIIIQVHPSVARILTHPGILGPIENEFNRKLTVESVLSMHPEEFTLLSQNE